MLGRHPAQRVERPGTRRHPCPCAAPSPGIVPPMAKASRARGRCSEARRVLCARLLQKSGQARRVARRNRAGMAGSGQ
jgi:hypothetical protein